MASEHSRGPSSALSALGARPPHPATVVQQKQPFLSQSARPPHPATVVQPKTVLALPQERPLHPALAMAVEQSPASISLTLQRSARSSKKKGHKDFATLLRAATGNSFVTRGYLIVSLAMDDDHSDLYTDSVKAYKDRGTVLNPSVEIVYDGANQTVTGSAPKGLFAQKQKPILVITAHGNLQWLFGQTPGNEDAEAQTFCTQFAAWLNQEAQTAKVINPAFTVENFFSAVMLDACWSASEPVLGNDTNVDCCARTLSRIVDPIAVVGVNGKTLNSVAVSYYGDSKLKSHPSVDYAKNVIVFKNGICVENNGDGQTHYHSTNLLGNAYYRQWLGKLVDQASYKTQ